MKRSIQHFIAIIFLTLPAFVYAQPVKSPLTIADCDQWKEITYKALSPDGRYAAFQLVPQDGDGAVLMIDTRTGRRDSIGRGAELLMTWDGAHALFRIKPASRVVKELRRQKKKKEEMPTDSLGIYTYASGSLVRIPEVRQWKAPARSGGWIAYTLEAPRDVKAKPTDAKGKKPKRNNDENGYTLVVRNLASGSEMKFPFVRDFAFARYGQGLLFSSSGNDSTMRAGVYWVAAGSNAAQPIYEGKPKYKVKGLSISEGGDQVAFLLDTDTTKALVHHWKLYRWKKGEARASDLQVEQQLPKDRLAGEHYVPHFSKSGARLYFGAAPYPVVADTTLLPEEVVQVEVWHSEDANIYPQQKVLLEQERKRSYLAVADLLAPTVSIRVLASPDAPTVELAGEGDATFALLATDVPYRKMATWDLGVYHDAWLTDVRTGARKQVVTKVKSKPTLSPGGNYVLWYSPTDTSWYSYATMTGTTVRLNKGIKVSFADEEDDHPDFPNQYGVAGWTTNDDRVLIYDRYDIWSIDPKGISPAVNLTNGRAAHDVFRYIKTDVDARHIDLTKELWLSVFNEQNKTSGFARLTMKNMKRVSAVHGPARYAGLMKARDAAQLLFTRETFGEFPDVWRTGMDFTKATRLTRANPQQVRYNWATVEPVSWTGPGGKTISGLLYKPEDFNPTRKYPMIVYFYERNSDELYAHHVPFPLRSSVNRTIYTSNGYLIFIPDIHYRVGYPGESAMECIMPGVKAMVEKGFVDESNIGIQGHSWGGYQTAYMLTKTGLFKAAEAGAIVANMVSAYGGIRWETGLSRMFQYEKDQSRIGATLWEKPELYLQNSPIFSADKITTPVLLLHNDADGAVPWYQGIEMYMALRRLGKPTWMLNYNGEPHWPVKRENRIDFQHRMMQFFDHYLKGAPAPVWMREGIPAMEKGVNKGY